MSNLALKSPAKTLDKLAVNNSDDITEGMKACKKLYWELI